MNSIIINILGWIPAVIFPTATILQLYSIYKAKNAEGVSSLTWFLFAIANFSLYGFTEKYLTIQSLIGQVGTGILDLIISYLAVKSRKK